MKTHPVDFTSAALAARTANLEPRTSSLDIAISIGLWLTAATVMFFAILFAI